MGNIFRYLRENVPSIDKVNLSSHCHDDLGMAVANSLAALKMAQHKLKVRLNGIGERAGNAALEEVAVALHIRQDYYQANNRFNAK